MLWWKTSEQIVGQRLDRFIEATLDPDEACIALFRRHDGAHVGLTMNDLGELIERHRERLQHPLTPPSDKQWMQRESELALLGARRLQQKFQVPLHTSCAPPQATPEPVLHGEGAAVYQSLMQRLYKPRPAP